MKRLLLEVLAEALAGFALLAMLAFFLACWSVG